MEAVDNNQRWKVLFSPLVQKLVLVTIVPILAGLALLAVLMLFQYEQIIRNAVEQRYLLSAGEIKTRSERWLKSGLLPQNVPNMQEILASIDKQIDEEFSVDIVNDSGVVIYSLDPSRLQDRIKASILRDFNLFIEKDHNEETNHLVYNENNQRFIITPLFDSIGNWVAAVIISFPQSSYSKLVDQTIYKIFYYFAIISLVITFIALVVGGIILKKPVQQLSELERRFAHLSDDTKDFHGEKLSPLEKKLTKNLRQMDKKSQEIHAIDIDTQASSNKKA